MKQTRTAVAAILFIAVVMMSSCSRYTNPYDAASSHSKCGRTVR